jgi:hypothetical protein
MTIAQQLNIKEFPFIIKDNKGNAIYCEQSSGYWFKREYDDKGNQIYYKDSLGWWFKKEYDDRGNEIYFEDSTGLIVDNRPKSVPEYTMEELTAKLGHNFKIKK